MGEVLLMPLFLFVVWSVPTAAVAVGLAQLARASRDRRPIEGLTGLAVAGVALGFTGIVVVADHGPIVGPALPTSLAGCMLAFAHGRRRDRAAAAVAAVIAAILVLAISLRPVLETTWSPGSLTVLLRASVLVWEVAGVLLFVSGTERLRRAGWSGWFPSGTTGAPAAAGGAAVVLLAPAFGAAVSHIGA